MAQTHPILAEGCSDFVVEFAADVDGNGEVDVVTDQESQNAYGDTRAEGNIRWYTSDAYANNRGSGGTPSGVFAITEPLTFPLPVGGYRNAVFQAAGGASGFVWRHDGFDPDAATAGDFFCNWPYLLRVRYRLHDGAGNVAGADSDMGVWFEQVVRVDRPYP